MPASEPHSTPLRALATLMLSGLAAFGCGGQQHVVVSDPGDLAFEIEDRLQAAEASLDQGDPTEAKRILAAARDRLASPEARSDPDRHVLGTRIGELEERAAGRAPVATAVAAPRSSSEPFPPPPRPPPPAQPSRAAADAAFLLASTAAAGPAPAVEMDDDEDDEDPSEAFRSGPVRDHRRGLKLLARAKRARKEERMGVYEEAAAALATCAEQGAALLKQHPELKARQFASGAKKVRGDKILKTCSKKLRWVQKKALKGKARLLGLALAR